MFSKRTAWPTKTNDLSALRAERPHALDLTSANPSENGFVYGDETLALLARDARIYKPEPLGLAVAREAVVDYYRHRGAECQVDDVIIAASTSELYSYLFALLCDPGEVVLLPRPSYPLLPFVAGLSSVKLAAYSLEYDDHWHLRTLRSLPPQVRAVVAIAPNNPTGNFLKHNELTLLESRCAAARAALIVDEVFADYPLQNRPQQVRTTVGDRACLTFTLSGLSKVALLPQAKLAWCVMSGPEKLKQTARRRLELIADTFLSTTTGAQSALPDLLTQSRAMRQRVQSRMAMNLMALDELLAGSALSRLSSEGGWSSIIRLPKTRDDAQWASHFLRSVSVAVQPGYFYDLGGCHVVVSLLPAAKKFREGISRLVGALEP